MIDILMQCDKILSQMVVSGDNVMLLAAARQALKQAYEKAKEANNAPINETR